MKFSITYLASTNDLRTVRSEDVPATIAKHLIATISLLEAFESDTTTPIVTTKMSEKDVAKINMYDALRAMGVENWEGWDLAAPHYEEMPSAKTAKVDESTEAANPMPPPPRL